MLKKHTYLLIKPKIFFCCLLAGFLFYQSCTKIDVTNTTQKSPTETAAQFFNLPSNADPLLQKVAAGLKSWNEKSNFVNGFAINEGMPQWQYASYGKTQAVALNIASQNGSEDTLVYLPIVLNEATNVNGFLAFRVHDTLVSASL
jgi:hypothetical protein